MKGKRTRRWLQNGGEHGRWAYPEGEPFVILTGLPWAQRLELLGVLGGRTILRTEPMAGSDPAPGWLPRTGRIQRLTWLVWTVPRTSGPQLPWVGMPDIARLDVAGLLMLQWASPEGHFWGLRPLHSTARSWKCPRSCLGSCTPVRYSFSSIKGKVLGTEVRSSVGQVIHSFIYSSGQVFVEHTSYPRRIPGPRAAAANHAKSLPLPVLRTYLSVVHWIWLVLFVHTLTCWLH